jgi:tetratricopeptide (TPR) repeat protein
MNRSLLAAAAIALLALTLFATAQTPDVASALDEARTTLSEKSLDDARTLILQLPQKDSAYFYTLARVDGYLCNAAQLRSDKKATSAALDRAIDEAQQALKLDEHSAIAHALLGDLYGQKIGIGSGMLLGPRFGPKIVAENKRALELDANNPRVLASVGRQYYYAPKMFGGDIDKAIENLKKSTDLDPRNDETFVWLALAYRKKGDAGSSARAIDEALQLNPRSTFAQNTKSGK